MISVIFLVLSNGITAAFAVWEQWSLSDVLWIYWGQSIIIGFFNLRRILRLKEFSTNGFRINNREVAPTRGTLVYVAFFFAFHYGFFHLMYFIFLVSMNPEVSSAGTWSFVGCMAVFAFNHRYSFHAHLESDLARKPNIGMVMMFPYARIMPMHLSVIAGLAMTDKTTQAMLLFMGLKTVADLAMHLIEHRGWRKE